MKILLVHSGNAVGGDSTKYTFVMEQGRALEQQGCTVSYYAVMGHGLRGYLRNVRPLRRAIRELQPDIVHAHYGLCGLLCCLQRKVPVVVTFHGSDINNRGIRCLSKLAMRLASWRIFVSDKTRKIAAPRNHYSVIPCGINLPKPAADCPDMSRVLTPGKKHVLFAGAFSKDVKDPELAKEVIRIYNHTLSAGEERGDASLIELKGYSRDEVSALMQQCDALLMTSKTEGSPQVIKEAMACGCPIVSTDVGDVRERTNGLDGCHVANSRNPQELADLLRKALAYDGRTAGRERILSDGLTNELVAQRLMDIYKTILK